MELATIMLTIKKYQVVHESFTRWLPRDLTHTNRIASELIALVQARAQVRGQVRLLVFLAPHHLLVQKVQTSSIM